MNELTLWNEPKQLSEVKKVFAPKLNETEFSFFVGLGKSLNANPFTREIWAVKYKDNEPATIFCGRDFYRKKSQEQSQYNGHTVDSVYSKDSFVVKNGTPEHSYSLADRGVLVGAYCVVHKKNTQIPYFTYVKVSEYSKSTPIWGKYPDTMIKKVAESQALRGAFQGIFSGTYDESEEFEEQKQIPASIQETEKEEIQEASTETTDAEFKEIVEPTTYVVDHVESVPYGEGKTFYKITISGVVYRTFSSTHSELASNFIATKEPVVITWEDSKKMVGEKVLKSIQSALNF